jgi:CheY-like chemotaxis protein
MKEGLSSCKITVEIHPVYDGVQVMDYLLRQGKYRDLSFTPDLILLDLNMPLMDGYAVLKEMKRHSTLRSIPIYVITTSRSVDHLNKALELGANGFYSKGSKSKEILQIMRDVCKECFQQEKH